jgi:hypothetical protein
MDYELSYLDRRAAEEERAGKTAATPLERSKHLYLANAFREQSMRIRRSPALGCEIAHEVCRHDD